MKDDFDKRNPRQEDADMTKTLGFPTFYESDREYLSADLAENKFLYINFDNYGSPQTKSLSVGNNGYVVRFNRPQVGSSREKIQKLAQAISF